MGGNNLRNKSLLSVTKLILIEKTETQNEFFCCPDNFHEDETLEIKQYIT